MDFEYAVALTGGIASGKSTATIMLSLFGFRFIDADKIAHQIIETQHQEIINIFGESSIVDGKVDRKALGKIIFSNKEKKIELEELMHPLIYKEILAQSKKQDRHQKPYLIDIPLFFEKGNYPIAESVVVYTPKSKQIERLMDRDKITKEEAIQKIESQMPINKKRDNATYIIDNSGDLKQLEIECEKVKKSILSNSLY
ncbi:Dephospho-CoA kinase [hydrothermal vent metagenome]|uniref:Dephospho-CoA kinase n=1 Tax=hydrothermal vent metagenome TaxID=652676 RepID=A0A1W1CGK7_9ZZZZ